MTAVVTLLALAATLAWRFAPGAWPLLPVVALLTVVHLTGALRDRRAWLAPFAGLAALVAIAGWLEALWPCPVTCAGAGDWQAVVGVPVAMIGATGAAVVAGLAVLGCWRLATAGAWLGVGGSLFFLALSAWLELWCPACLAVHGLVLCWPAALWRQRPGPVAGAGLALMAMIGWSGAYHDRLPYAEPLATPEAATDLVAKALVGRVYGLAQAPWKAILVFDLQCSHCASAWPGLWSAAAPAIGRGDLRLELRHRVPRVDAGGRHLAALGLAAAADGSYREHLGRLFVADTGLAPTAVERRLALDPRLPISVWSSAVASKPAAYAAALEAEAAHLRRLGADRGAVPVLLLEHPDGTVSRLRGADVTGTALMEHLRDTAAAPAGSKG